jgi:hypothetical protein
MAVRSLKAQQAIEFISVYAWALLGLTLFIAIVIAISTGQNKLIYPSARCYIEPAFPCYNMYVMPNSLVGSVVTLVFTNNLGNPLWFPPNSFYVSIGGNNYSGACYPEGQNTGLGIYCYAGTPGFSPSLGTQLQPSFYISYNICQDALYSASGETCQGKSLDELPVYNTSGSALLTVSPYTTKIWAPYTMSTAYFASTGLGLVSLSDTALNFVWNSISLGTESYPGTGFLSPNGTIYFSDSWATGQVYVINAQTGNVITISPPTGAPGAIAFYGNSLIIADGCGSGCGGTGDVWFYNAPSYNSIAREVNVPAGFWGIASMVTVPDGNIYINADNGDVSSVNYYTLKETHYGSIGGYSQLLVSPNNQCLYAISTPVYSAPALSAVNIGGHCGSQSVGSLGTLGGWWPEAEVLSPNGADLYVSNFWVGEIDVVNTSAGSVNSIYLNNSYNNIADAMDINPNGRYLYVLTNNGNLFLPTQVQIINTMTGAVVASLTFPNTATLPGGASIAISYDMSLSPNGAYVYLYCPYSNEVYVISTQTDQVVDTFTA